MRLPAALISLALLAAPCAGLGQTLDDAKAFTLGLYLAYAHREPDYLGAGAQRVFSPRLLGLIRRDERLTPAGDVPSLDGDPVCDCQDPEGLGQVRVEVTTVGPGRARADVRFRFPDGPHEVTLDLVSVRSHWRIDDAHTRDTPSLVRFLEDAHPRARRHP